MERTIGIEEARAKLGEIAEEVADGGDPVVLAKRGRARAVIVDREDYARYKEHSARAARAELQKLLPQIRSQVERVGLDRGMISRAIDAAERLD